MRLLLVEYLHAASWEYHGAPDSMRLEGRAMLSCLAADFGKLVGSDQLKSLFVAACSAATSELTNGELGGSAREISHTDSIEQLTSELIRTYRACRCDKMLLVAPESDQILRQMLKDLRAAGCCLLAAGAELVDIGTDKLRTFEFCRNHDLPTIETWTTVTAAVEAFACQSGNTNCVIKPRDGVSCDGIRRLPIHQISDQFKANDLIQPWVEGSAWSVALIRSDGGQVILPPVQQLIEWVDDRPAYRGSCLLPGSALPDADGLDQLLRRVLPVLPEFSGYVGLDLLFTDTGWLLVEINPRVCSSYAVYHRSCLVNLAEAFLGPRAVSSMEYLEAEFRL